MIFLMTLRTECPVCVCVVLCVSVGRNESLGTIQCSRKSKAVMRTPIKGGRQVDLLVQACMAFPLSASQHSQSAFSTPAAAGVCVCGGGKKR